MARKPIHLQAAGKLTPRERIWQALRALRRGFSRGDLVVYLRRNGPRVEESTIQTYLDGLCAAGFIGREHVFATGALYQLMRDAGVEAPRVTRNGKPVTQGAGTQNLWTSMRAQKAFDYRELIGTAAVAIAPASAKSYCRMLERAGYLVADRAGKGGIPTRYRLVRNTGPLAPMIQRVKHVYDPNLGEVVWHPGANA